MFDPQPVEFVKGIGPDYARRLQKRGLNSVQDMLLYAPFRYDDLRFLVNTKNYEFDKLQYFVGEIKNLTPIRAKQGKLIYKGVFEDESGELPVIWFYSAYLMTSFKKVKKIALIGKVTTYGGVPTLIAPSWLEYAESSPHYGRMVPVYEEFDGITTKWYRTKLWEIVNSDKYNIGQAKIADAYFKDIECVPYASAVKKLHFPNDIGEVEKAIARLGLDEIVFEMVRNELNRRRSRERNSLEIPSQLSIDIEYQKYTENLSFTLSDSQTAVLKQIWQEVTSTTVNRLLVGDVGSGKTVIAAGLMYLSVKCGHRAVIMAPTQILAAQHADSLSKMFAVHGIRVGLLTTDSEVSEDTDIIVGTHALLHRDMQSWGIRTVVVDEQHRFGVMQREKLRTQFGERVNFLSMTATPIPRTLSLVSMGHLDVSYIEKRKDGRSAAVTRVVPTSRRKEAYTWVVEKLRAGGGQLFVVCPFISPSESFETVKAASVVYDDVKALFGDTMRVELLHGSMKMEEKERLLVDFRDGKINVLVTTPVVEVGIDIPNANFIIVESADRFGLAQLHQLRGRVGRRGQQCYCLLMPGDEKQDQNARLQVMAEQDDGYALAKFDLKNRGAGVLYGIEQHGFRQFRFADILDEIFVDKAVIVTEAVISELLHAADQNELSRYYDDNTVLH